MRIALDLDGTLVDFIGAVCEQHNLEFGSDLSEDDINRWDFLPLTHFESWQDFWPWVRTRSLFTCARPYPSGPLVVRRLMNSGDHLITAVTHRPGWAKPDTSRWLLRHVGAPPIVFTDDKTQLDFDLFIDDSPDIIERLCRRGVNTMRMVRPWNHPCPGATDITDWQQIAEALL